MANETPNPNPPKPPEPRGAGSGKAAVESRNRTALVDWPPPPKSHAEHVAELEEQAQKNEDYNNEMNEIQTDQAAEYNQLVADQRAQETEGEEQQQEDAKKAYLNQTDFATRKKAAENAAKARARGIKERTQDKVGAAK